MSSSSNLQKILESGTFAVCGEMSPPAGPDKESILRKCGYFRGKVDAVNLTDNQTAIVRMSSLMSSVYCLEGECEPVMQLTCRDRNRLAQQSELISAYSAGIKNVLCLTGDYQSFGNHPDAKGVFDLDSTQLVHTVREMNSGRFLSGDELKPPLNMFIGAAANPFAEPMEMRIINLYKKVAAGAQFVQTQPVFDLPRFEKWMELVRCENLHNQTHILAGVMPVRSVKALQYMADSVPGMSIAQQYIDRMATAEDPKAEGVNICVEIMQSLQQIEGVHGVHIMPVMWESITASVVERAGLLPRPAPEVHQDGDNHEQA